jgi:UDP:flavonoid glycosyltransferase YjiC (YdhE family)
MARIVITTLGSAGDLNPFIALGLGLSERGHTVVFAVEDSFRPHLLTAGFEVRHLSGDVEAFMRENADEMFGNSATPISSIKAIVRKYIVPNLRAKVEELKAICQEADLVVAHTQQIAATIVSELTGVRLVTVSLTPAALPSAYVAPNPWPLELPDPLLHLANRLSWSVGLALLRPIVDKPLNAVRAEYGLPPRHNLLNDGNLSPLLSAIATSPAFVEPKPDWPQGVKLTGFCFWDTPHAWEESAELRAFLDGGKPVVAVSSGSMGPGVEKAFDQIYLTSIRVLRQLGARVLIIGAAPGSLPEKLPEEVMALPFAPFSAIYPRCAAVIHHGGIGTTAQALRAGVPMLVVPWGADQFFTAAQVKHLGVGEYLARRSYVPARASKLLKALLEEGSYREQSQAVAARIAQEDGVAQLCTALEGVLKEAGLVV